MKNYKSIIAALLVTVIYSFSAHVYKPYKILYYHTEGDALGYYMYLPAFFIHHDLNDLRTSMLAKYKHADPGKIINNVAPGLNAEARPAPNGHPVIKYSMGVAVLQAPFFLIAHFLAGILRQPQDGFSMIYMYAIQISMILYVLLGFLVLIFILERSFSDTVIAWVIITIGLATNLYCLASYNEPMCHAYLFFLYAVLLYAVIRYYATFSLWILLFIGFCCGMITLTRANEVYVVIIPLLWGLGSRNDVKQRLALIMSRIPSFIGVAFVFLLCLLPQIIYWKMVSGHFLYYSYGDEKFSFLHPHIIDGLFSFGNGWLAYSPIMYMAIIGIWFAYRRGDASIAPLLVFLPLHIYVIYSWWCYFYMGSYGSRPMTEAYPLLSIPLAYTIDLLWQSWIKKIFLVLIITFFSWLTVFQIYQSSLNIFNSVVGNWRFNLVTFGKTKISYDDAVVMDTKEFQPKDPVLIKHLCDNGFEDSTLTGSTTRFFQSVRRSVCVHSGQFLDGCKMSLRDAGLHPGQWIRASVKCYAVDVPSNLWEPSSLAMDFTIKRRSVKWRAIRLQNKIDNPNHGIWCFNTGKWGDPYFYSQIPGKMTMDDTINVFIWNGNPHGPDIYVDDLSVDVYDNK